MGNKQFSGELTSSKGAEMGSARYFKDSRSGPAEPRTVDELWEDCLALRNGCQILAEAVEDIFDDEESEESTPELETRLQGLTKINQDLVCALTRDMEVHAKLVCRQPEGNENLIALVKEVVSTVNSYMATLIQNIRKLRRLTLEMVEQNSNTSSSASLSKMKQNAKGHLVYDVIGDSQDVDAMLVQLQQTQKQREELERDIVTVLVCWRDFTSVMAGDEAEPESVMAAADSVALGLAQLNR